MNTYNKETLYVCRNAQGDITDVFEGNPDRYYKVVDTVIKIDSSESERASDRMGIKVTK